MDDPFWQLIIRGGVALAVRSLSTVRYWSREYGDDIRTVAAICTIVGFPVTMLAAVIAIWLGILRLGS